MSKSKSGLTAMQQLFVKEYLVDLNATQAAIRAGYSANTATEQSSRLLANVKVQKAVQEAMARREKRTDITAERVLSELGKIAFSDLNAFIEVSEDGKITVKPSNQLDGTVLSEISESITTNGRTRKVKLHDKMKALELIGRHLAMFTDKQEIKIEKTDDDKQAAINQLKKMLEQSEPPSEE
ncbi:terminase small subunit [Paenibacillus sp. NPDC058367]|uniref:terminase small subunit n=1 Tax=Paenibacillus sp. NPDC058367 TaxID=3346460 RepID=UPI0036660CDD